MQVGERFLVQKWSDGCAVFDQSTGNTHSLDPVVFAGFLAALNQEDVALAISAALQALHPDRTKDELVVLVQDCLDRLESCGLIKSGKVN